MAVSKTKPVELLQEAYEAGQRDFGENYVQELVEKAQPGVMPADTAWRFIGKLQSNKAKTLVKGVPGLVAVETLTSLLADKLQAAAAALPEPPLRSTSSAGGHVAVGRDQGRGRRGGLAAHVQDNCRRCRRA